MTAHALRARHVDDSGEVGRDQSREDSARRGEVERRSEFVLEEGLRLAALKRLHRLVEETHPSRTAWPVKQADARHDAPWNLSHEILGQALGTAVGENGDRGVVLAIPGFRTVEDQISRSEEQPAATIAAPPGEPPGRFDVDPSPEFGLKPNRLGGADRGGVKDRVGIDGGQLPFDRRWIGDIHARKPGSRDLPFGDSAPGDDVMSFRLEAWKEVRAELSTRSRQNNPHARYLQSEEGKDFEIGREPAAPGADSVDKAESETSLFTATAEASATRERAVEIVELEIDNLVLDPNLYLRDRLDDFTVERYADSWQRLPPVTVFQVEGSYLLVDGYHRHAAAVMLGHNMIQAELMHGSFTEALDFAASVNLFHGLPLTRSERRRAVEVKLKLHHDWSDRKMAEDLAVSRELVAKTRKMLIEGKVIPNNPGRVGADGKMYSSAGLPKDPGERLPKTNAAGGESSPRDLGRRESDHVAVMEPPMPVAVSAVAQTAPPWEEPDAKTVALSEPVTPSAPTIEEMLSLMAKQIMEVVNWTQTDGFIDAYRTASGNARGLFQAAVIKLAARGDQLRKA